MAKNTRRKLAAILAAKPIATSAQREEVTQFSLSVWKSHREELVRRSTDADITMGAFVLMALKDKGLTFTGEDLIDRRKKRGGTADG